MHGPHVRPVYTIFKLCEDFGVSRSKVYEEIAASRLKTFKFGPRQTRIAGEDALAWRETYRQAAEQQKP